MKKLGIFTGFTGIILMVALTIGYIANIYRACKLDYESPYKAEAIRVIGIFIPPMGGVVGYIDIEDTELKK